MLVDRMETALNKQVHAETYSFYLYLAMAADFDAKNLDGFAHWMRAQAREELAHAFKFMTYIQARGGVVRLEALDAPPAQWDSPAAAFAAALEHERSITRRIGTLVDLADGEKDHATHVFLNWFVNEQVEEEATAEKILHQVKMVESSTQGLLMLDRHLAQREG